MNPDRRRSLAVAVLAAVAVVGVGCASGSQVAVDPQRLDEAVSVLTRSLPGDLAALYSMRLARSGGLRLAVITAGESGRMTVSEPFGAAVSLTAWSAEGPAIHLELNEGCRSAASDLKEILGVGALPLGQAVRLLGGRLPAAPGDRLTIGSDSGIEVMGDGWAARVRVAPDPWRVVEVAELGAASGRGWVIELGDHTSSVPGRIRVVSADGRWAELRLTRMEWPDRQVLPELPDLPPCGPS
jgi:hypothetical protein